MNSIKRVVIETVSGLFGGTAAVLKTDVESTATSFVPRLYDRFQEE